MKKFYLVIIFIVFVVSSNAQDTWTQKADFGGIARYAAVGFSIGTKGYIGTGTDGLVRQQSFWEWNQATNAWTQKADFVGAARYTAVGFSIGTKGYVGTGEIGGFTNNFWEWDQTTNSWTSKANFGGTVRWGATGFSIGTKGYIGTGNDGANQQDFWEWDQATDVWTRKADFGGTARYSAVGFSIGTKGYIGTGNDGVNKQDFWEWDQATDVWTRKADFGGTARHAAVGFSIGTKGYIGTGNDGANQQDFWEWNQATDIWVQKASFGGTTRYYATGFSIGAKGYIGTGLDVANKQDFWEWNPPPSKINSYEYWFDNSYAARTTTGISPVGSFNFISTVSTIGLTDGLHTFHIHFRDDNSRYSSVVSQFFQKIPTTTITNRQIVAYEYWYDNNFGAKISQSVTAQSQIQVITGLTASALADGLHTFHIRFKDDAGVWSSVVSQFFQKIPASSVTNHKIVAYEYWYDNGFGSKVSQSVTAQSQVQVISGLSAPSLNDGLHTFHIRFKDDAGVWSSVVSQFFQKIPASSVTNHQVVAYEYWYDNSFGTKVSQTVSAQSQVQVITGLSASSLNDGLHTFHVRFKDDAGAWSSVVSQFFQKIPASSVTNHQVVAYEYWYDNGFGAKVSQSVAAQSQVQVITGLSASALNDGLHTIHVRFKDDAGDWSSVVSQFFQKIPATSVANHQIVAYEYWYDNNFGSKVSQSVTAQTQIQVITGLSASALTNGLHTFHFRFKDDADRWSSVVNQFFQKISPSASIPNLITAYRYWIDTAFASVTNINLSTPVNPYGLLTNIDMTGIRKGSHIIHFQFRDTLQQWSVALTDTFNKNLLLIPSFTANNTSFCDSGIVSFTNNSVDGDKYLWNFGDGNTDTLFSPSHTYTTTGNFSVQLTITDTASLLDSTIIITNLVTVTATPSNAVAVIGNDSICQGKSMTLNASAIGAAYLWSTGTTTQSITVSATGNYSVAVNVNGCISQSNTYSITIIPNPSTPTIMASGSTTFCTGNSVTLSSSTNNSYLWNNGSTTQNITISASGNYSVKVANGFGCTATSTTTNITVNSLPSTPTITANGSTTFCPGNSVTLSSIAENSYLWNNGSTMQSITVGASGNYSVTVANGLGCTAMSLPINVTVNSNPTTPIITAGSPTTFCQGDSVALTSSSANTYLWSNSSTVQSIAVNTSGNYSVIVSNSAGCTAVSNVQNILANPNPVVTASIANDTFCLSSPAGNLIGSPSGGIWSGQGVVGNTFDPDSAGAGLWNIIYTYSDANNCSSTDTLLLYVDLCTGVSESPGNMSVFVYPNPIFGEITVLTENLIADEILISDALGKIILSIKPKESNNRFNLSELASGVYFLHVKSGDSIHHRKIIKE